MTIHRWSQEILDTLEEKWNEVAAEDVARDANFAKVWEVLRGVPRRVRNLEGARLSELGPS